MITIRDAKKLLASKSHITFDELAEITGTAVGTLRVRAHRGTLPLEFSQPGGPNGLRLIPVEAVEAAISAGKINLNN